MALTHIVNTLTIGYSPIIDSWPLLSNPVPFVLILLAYLTFVLKIGPQFMKNRKPYNFKWLLVFYNAYQVIFSIWLCVNLIRVDGVLGYIFNKNCQYSDRTNTAMNNLNWACSYWYFISRVIDLLDTIFFTLRKKENQITFLHVFHHTLTVTLAWCYVKFCPEEQGTVVGFLNSFVHVFMYFYYLLAVLGPSVQKYLWWKQYITVLQLVQFVLTIIYLVYTVVVDCDLSSKLSMMFGANACIYIYLFSDFYIKSYTKKSQKYKN